MKECVAIDIFCGVGGLTHGLVNGGIKVVAGVDSDPTCRYAYETNNSARFIHKKAEDLTREEISAWYPEGCTRVLVGCAPCQPYSTYSQKRKGDEWKLLDDFARLIVEVSPDVVSMENVTRLRRFKGGEVFDGFVAELEAAGYTVSSYDVFCPNYGIAQRRKRLVLFASKTGRVDLAPATHSPDEYLTVEDVIGELKEIGHGEVDPDDPIHRASELSPRNLARIKSSKPGGTWRDWEGDLRAGCHTKETGKTYVSVYGRMRWKEPSPTLTTQCFGFGNGRFGHPQQDRGISLREAALLQSFPREYDFVPSGERVYMKVVGRQIGNAVPPILGTTIARSILAHQQKYIDTSREASHS